MVDVLEPLTSRLSLPLRTTIRVFRKLFPNVYQLNLFAGQRGLKWVRDRYDTRLETFRTSSD
jgi:hypothetical protein